MHYKKILKKGIYLGLAASLSVSAVSLNVDALHYTLPLTGQTGSHVSDTQPSDTMYPGMQPSEETQPPKESNPPGETQPPEESRPPEETPPPEESAPPEETQPPEESQPPEETQPPEESQPPEETQPPEESKPPEETPPPEEPQPPAGGNPPEESATEQSPSASAGAEENEGGASSNNALIQSQKIIEVPVVFEDFRFVTVEKVYAQANMESVKVHEEMDESSRKVGHMAKGDVCFVLKEESQWIYIESGVVRGFVKREALLLGEEAKKAVAQKKEKHVSLTLDLASLQKEEESAQKRQEIYQALQEDKVPEAEKAPKKIMDMGEHSVPSDKPEYKGMAKYSLKLESIKKGKTQVKGAEAERKAQKAAERAEQAAESHIDNPSQKEEKTSQKAEDGIQEQLEQKEEELLTALKNTELTYAEADVDPLANTALRYTRTTVKATVVDKKYAVAKEEVKIRSEGKADGLEVGILPADGISYVLADEKSPWVYIESGNVRGFVSSSQLLLGEEAESLVKSKGEETLETASELVKPKDNPALYYTLTSIREGRISSAIRESVVNFARQFIGNPYVWGGTSLTQGADCSGFVQTIFNDYYGYKLPRVAEDQAQYGDKIRVEDAQPGDLIFYAKAGYIYHVVMYAGDGKTIEAQSTKTGIVQGSVNMENAVWATRFIDDTDTDTIQQVSQRAEQQDAVYQTASEGQLGEKLGNFKLTAYCNCAFCCGQWSGGPTASGTEPTQGRTVAMGGIPFGTRLVINGQIYTVEDRGTPYGHVDMYMNSHEECNQFGVQYADVYLLK